MTVLKFGIRNSEFGAPASASRTPLPAPRTPKHGGFTLMEVLLALALSGVVLFLVAMAIRIHLRATDSRRMQIEEARLARAVLQRISDDLRSTIQYRPVDFSSVEGLGGLDALDDLEDELGESGEDLDELEDELGGVGDDESDEEDGIAPGSVASQVAPPARPGLYGNRYELQIDVSRLPRLDEYDRLVRGDDPLAPIDLPSDIKTVAYYLVGPDAPTAMGGGLNDNRLSGGGDRGAAAEAYALESLDPLSPQEGGELPVRGLVRRSLDRAVTQYAVDSGNLDGIHRAGELLAPEVVALEFSYTDGHEWYDEWDTELQGRLPVAVLVAIAIDMRAEERDELSIYTASLIGGEGEASPDVVVYRLLVHLPAAERAEEGELPPIEEAPL